MLKRILGLLRGGPQVVEGTDRLGEGQAKKLTFGDPLAGSGTELILCRVDGELHALDIACPHEGGRLVDGELIDGVYARCPLHLYLFHPKSGEERNHACGKAKTYRVREKGTACEIWI